MSVYIRKELNTFRIGLVDRQGDANMAAVTSFLKTIYTYMQLVMPLREEWKSSKIRVDPQAVVRGEWRVFKTILAIILRRAGWIHIVHMWSRFSEITKKLKNINPICCLTMQNVCRGILDTL